MQNLLGVSAARFGLIAIPPFGRYYVPVWLDAAGRALVVPPNMDLQVGSGASAIAIVPGTDQTLDFGRPSFQIRDIWFGGTLYSGGHRVGYNLAVYAAGTAYALTATSALLNFGTTDPSLALDKVGTYLLLARCQLRYNAATFAANQTTTLKLRNITDPPLADVPNSAVTARTRIITAITDTFIEHSWSMIYVNAFSSSVVQMWGSVSATPTAGSLDAVEASIAAVRLY
jgi:hypothetical protein